MKKRIQKYLAGEREGFSLVELIIVIAIMAILIGVVALAVIPNIGRSRESKDLQALDNVLSATNTAIANLKVTTGVTADVKYEQNSSNDVVKAVYAELGAITLGSKNGTGKDIMIKYTVSDNGAAEVLVGAGATTKSDANKCVYTDNTYLVVSSKE